MTTVLISPQTREVPAAIPQTSTLIRRTLADRWRSVLGWAIGLVAMASLQLAVYPSVASSADAMQQFVDEWPAAFRDAFNLDQYGTGAGFLNAELFSLMVPLILIAVALGGAAAATAGEEERGTADLLVSLPVTRTRVLVAKVVATVVCVVFVAAAGLTTIALGSPIVDLDVGLSEVAAATTMTTLLALVFGSLGLLLGAVTGRRAIALGVGMGVALAAFLLHALAGMAEWLEPWQNISPFHWALDNNPLMNGMDWPMAGLMLGLAVVLTVLAHLIYRQRDLESR